MNRESLGIAASLVTLAALVSCGGVTPPQVASDPAIQACLHAVTPKPQVFRPASDPTDAFRAAPYERPCPAAVPQAEAQAWDVAVVGPDDRTVSVYFTGGPVGDRCGLLQRIDVVETETDVTITLYLGIDPALARQPEASCESIGQLIVTNVALQQPLDTRQLRTPVGGTVMRG